MKNEGTNGDNEKAIGFNNEEIECGIYFVLF